MHKKFFVRGLDNEQEIENFTKSKFYFWIFNSKIKQFRLLDFKYPRTKELTVS